MGISNTFNRYVERLRSDRSAKGMRGMAKGGMLFMVPAVGAVTMGMSFVFAMAASAAPGSKGKPNWIARAHVGAVAAGAAAGPTAISLLSGSSSLALAAGVAGGVFLLAPMILGAGMVATSVAYFIPRTIDRVINPKAYTPKF